MQHKWIMLLSLIFIATNLTKLYGQEAVASSGGNVTTSGGSLSYTIGQTVYMPISGGNCFLIQGVQQPFEFRFKKANTFPLVSNMFICHTFPNPVTDYLILKIEGIENLQLSSLIYQLRSIEGKLIESKKITSYETAVSMRKLQPSYYQMSVISNSKPIFSRIIIKK